jgi:hypothetical protein
MEKKGKKMPEKRVQELKDKGEEIKVQIYHKLSKENGHVLI